MNSLERPENIERNNRIRELRSKGMGPTAIAARMEVTRNIVIGVLNRSGVKMADDELRRRRSAAGKRSGQALNKPVYDPVKAAAGRQAALDRREEPVPPTAVPHGSVTGCLWPHGDPKDGLLYCNARCCKVRGANGVIYPVSYCSTHWESRRASKYTKVLA
jgi:hypothetical protein